MDEDFGFDEPVKRPRPKLNIWDLLSVLTVLAALGYCSVLCFPVRQPHQPGEPAQAAHPHAVPVPHGDDHAHPARCHVDAHLHQRHGYADSRADHYAGAVCHADLSGPADADSHFARLRRTRPRRRIALASPPLRASSSTPTWPATGRASAARSWMPAARRCSTGPCGSPAPSTASPSTS